VSKYEHPAWGRTEQLGLLWHLSATPARLFGPPVIHGQHSREILTELGYDAETIEALASAGVTTLPDLAR
jgi:crotonobetainyl-CoA:carnitine CoA-transferase CaiB-like acyl-CoA transferase